MSPQRIQRRRTKGWRMPAGAVYVGRPTRWGNPFEFRTPHGLARVPAVEDPGAEWEYEGRISADGTRHDYHHPDGRVTVCHVRYMTRAECVETYRRALTGNDSAAMRSAFPHGLGKWLGYWAKDAKGLRVREYVTVDDVRRELAGRDLVCWCPLDEPCHADVLLELANAPSRNASVSSSTPEGV